MFTDIFNSIIDFLNNALQGFVDLILAILPNSPFRKFIDTFNSIPFLEALNWVIPIDVFILIGEGWLVAISIFYIYSAILRWIKAIE